MIDRLLKLIVALTLLLFLLQALIGLLARVLDGALHGLIASVGAVGDIVGAMVLVAGVFSLALGLIVRSTRFLMARDPRVTRERAARERAGRTRVRRFAEGAPIHQREVTPADPDPAINEVAD